jgi:hypothetical protein
MMMPEPGGWWRAEGGRIEPVAIVAYDDKTVTRLLEGRKIRSRRAKGGVFYCSDWEEARQCLLAWNQQQAQAAQKELERTQGWHDSWMQYQCRKAQTQLSVCERHRRWLEALEPPDIL